MRPADLIEFKRSGKLITILTAWDSLTASIVQAAGADVVLVGDSLAMVALGYATTLPATLEQMLHHTKAVERGFSGPSKEHPLLITDLPFLSYQCGEDKAVEAAGTLIKNTCAKAVKLEGAEPEVIGVIKRLIRMGIPVMGHLGLTPQSVHKTGYSRQAEDPISQEKLRVQAIELEEAGCFAIVLEHIPSSLAKDLRSKLSIPIIGIGAGNNCDGQIRVTADLLGLTQKQPPFSPALISGHQLCVEALETWVKKQRHQAKNPTKEVTQPESD